MVGRHHYKSCYVNCTLYGRRIVWYKYKYGAMYMEVSSLPSPVAALGWMVMVVAGMYMLVYQLN